MSYTAKFRSKLSQEPIKHRLRLLQFQYQRFKQHLRLQQVNQGLSDHVLQSMVTVPPALQPPPYHYRNYQGPWIEEYFYEFWIKNQIHSQFTYLPIFFDGFFLHSQTHKYTPREFERIYDQMQYLLTTQLQLEQGYFTILGMYDFPIWNWHTFPKNVLVFSAAGGGDIPIPLLKGSPAFQCPPKEITVSFMGSLDGASNRGGVRKTMYERLKNFAHFGQGPHWRDVMSKSTFTLCPRGQAPASFRLYEALSVGSIPIYIWDDVEWLPYQDVLDWSEFSISVNVKDCDCIPELIQSHSEADIRRKQERIAELYPQFFTLEAVCQNILRMLQGYKTVKDIYQITEHRSIV